MSTNGPVQTAYSLFSGNFLTVLLDYFVDISHLAKAWQNMKQKILKPLAKVDITENFQLSLVLPVKSELLVRTKLRVHSPDVLPSCAGAAVIKLLCPALVSTHKVGRQQRDVGMSSI